MFKPELILSIFYILLGTLIYCNNYLFVAAVLSMNHVTFNELHIFSRHKETLNHSVYNQIWIYMGFTGHKMYEEL